MVLLALAGAPALAQAPAQEAPKNLQVLPKDWTRAQVVNVMQNINAALGVGCDYCHVQNQGAPPDFAADDKPEKKAARAMMKLTGELNTDLVAALERPAAEVTRVGCITCHRGVPEPKQLSEILAKTSADKGFPAAKAQYDELKAKYYGAQAYDFSDAGLIATAQPLVQGRTDEAIQFLRMNLDLFPRSARTYVALSQAQVAKQDRAGAIASLEKALEIEPNNAAAKRSLDQLRAQR
ncbi:MAG TPA: c-type cytochrome [Gammaproteobacteria bacterium]|nr:c-type cytochrome [Gammaproteobacteria bacterium]